MPLVAARFDAEAAWRVLHRRWPWSARRPLRMARSGPADLPYPCLELVGMPCYLVDFVSAGAHITCRVDAIHGAVTLLDSAPPDPDIRALEQFDPAFDDSHAAELARTLLLRSLVHRRASGVTLGPPTSARLVHWPWWVYYYQRSGRIRIRALDAVTGSIAGHRHRLALLEAFQRASRNRKDLHGEISN